MTPPSWPEALVPVGALRPQGGAHGEAVARHVPPARVHAGAAGWVLCTAALVLVLVPVLGVPAAAAEGRELLELAVDRGRLVPHRGEVIAITWVGGRTHVTMSEVDQGVGTTSVAATGRQLQLTSWGGGFADQEQGWYQTLPSTGGWSAPTGDLGEKYDVVVAGQGRVLDRPTLRLEITRRDDGRRREAFEIDETTGLVLRRDSYDGDVQLRMATYSRLELHTDADPTPAPMSALAGPALEWRGSDVMPVNRTRLDALRTAGWTVPGELPDGYRSTGVYAVSGAGGQRLQQVFDDGLYSASLFQQRGRPAWDALPAGAQPVPGLGERAAEWPGATPSRIVWEAAGRTYALVGDAPPAELRALAAAVPAPSSPPGFGMRLRTGMEKLWTWVADRV
jgi:hypothetical protein